MISDRKRQAGVFHRGVTLPDGMTPQCLDELATMFNDFADGLLAVGGEEVSYVEAAVMAYELVVGPSSQKEPSPLQRSADELDSCGRKIV